MHVNMTICCDSIDQAKKLHEELLLVGACVARTSIGHKVEIMNARLADVEAATRVTSAFLARELRSAR